MLELLSDEAGRDAIDAADELREVLRLVN